MLRFMTSLMTAATVLWHAVVGCQTCHSRHVEARADHGTVSECCNTFTCRRNDCTCKSRSCKAHESSTKREVCTAGTSSCVVQNDSHELPSEPCDGSSCLSCSSKSIPMERPFFRDCAVSWLASADLLVIDGRHLSASRTARPMDDRPPSLRSHLALRILLI